MKKHISLVFLGHEGSGKSTIGGHLLFKLGMVGEREIRKYEDELFEYGRGSSTWKYAWVMDRKKYERDRMSTMEAKVRKFETNRFVVSMVDTPGRLIKNTIIGISQADVAVVVTDSSNDGFEMSLRRGTMKELLILSFCFGVKKVIVLVNKMDKSYSVVHQNSLNEDLHEKRFYEIRDRVKSMLKQIGFNSKKTPICPVSGWTGENLCEPFKKSKHFWTKDKTKWGGMTFLQIIDSMKAPKRSVLKKCPLRIPISRVVYSYGLGTIVMGRVETGILKRGMNVEISAERRSKSKG